MSKYFWMPSSDGTIIYVKKIYETRFFGERIKNIAYFYSGGGGYGWDYDGAIQVAEDLIKRLEKAAFTSRQSGKKKV